MIDWKKLSPEGQKRIEDQIGSMIDKGQRMVRANLHNHVPAVKHALLSVVFTPGSEARITLKTVEETLYYQAWIESMLEGLFALDKERTSFCQLELRNGSCILLGMEGDTDDSKTGSEGPEGTEAPNASPKARR